MPKSSKSRCKNKIFIMLNNKAGWPSTTGNPSGGGRDNNPPKR